MSRYILFLLFAVKALFSADDHHNYAGTVNYSGPYGHGTASFQMTDFDPRHTHSLGLQNLYRMSITPIPGYILNVPIILTTGNVSVTGYTNGSYRWQGAGWNLLITPSDPNIRAQIAASPIQIVTFQEIIIQMSETASGVVEITGKN